MDGDQSLLRRCITPGDLKFHRHIMELVKDEYALPPLATFVEYAQTWKPKENEEGVR